MNGDDQGPTLGDFNPSWMQTGGISGDSQVYEAPFDQDDSPWDTDAWTRNSQDIGEVRGAASGCLADAGEPPDMGTYVLGSVDGTCQWIGKTDCA